MSDRSAIEWTEATWNPVTGCTKVSPGCAHCYAETFAERFRGVPGHPYEQGFDMKLWPERLGLLSKWKHPRMIFVNSMSDLFHENVPDEFILKVFSAMLQANHHTYQVLTKRAERMRSWTRKYFRSIDSRNGNKRVLPSHIWLGVSVENQNYTYRIKHLQQTPAAVRFLSIEPLLAPVSLSASLLDQIVWVIVGGESGPRARRMKLEWVREIRRNCHGQGVRFFFKQWGAHDSFGRRVGKKVAGRVLDGRTWNEMPRKNALERLSRVASVHFEKGKGLIRHSLP